MLSKWKSRLLLGFAAVLLVARFIHLEKSPFILDEPHFQLLIDQSLRAHTFPRVALHGIKGVAYGPTVLWFYLPLRLLSANVTALVAWNALFSVLGALALYFAVRKAAGKKVAAWALALTAASPYLFMYSRLAWDQPLLVPLLGAIAWVIATLQEKPLSPWLWGALGILSGLCFNLHLSTLPVLFAAGVVLLWLGGSAWRKGELGRLMACAGVFLAASLAVVAPYLLALRPGQANLDATFWPEDALRSLYYSSRFFSWKRMDTFFPSPATRGHFSRLIFLIDWSYALRISACVAIWLWLRKAWRERSLAKTPLLIAFGIISWLTLLVFYAIARPDIKNPHYLLPVWWVLFFFASWSIVHWRGRLRALLEACGWLTICLNALFIGMSWGWLDANSGARSLEYGPAQSEIARTIRELCVAARGARAAGAIPVGIAGANLFPESLEFFSAHEPLCAGEKFDFTLDTSKPARFEIEYASKTGPSALLAVEETRAPRKDF